MITHIIKNIMSGQDNNPPNKIKQLTDFKSETMILDSGRQFPLLICPLKTIDLIQVEATCFNETSCRWRILKIILS